MKQALLEIVVLFIIMGCGLVLGKRNLIDERMSNKMSTLVLSFTFPLLIISSMDREFDRSMFRNSVILVAFSAIICLVLLLIIELEVRLRKNPPDTMSVRHFTTMFGNASFMGIPVLSALYGADGVFYAAVMNVVFNFFMFSYGIFILCRSQHPNLRKIFLNPGFLGTVIGLVLFLTPLSLPYVLSRPISWCGEMTIPLALLVAGSIVSRNKLREIVRPASVWYISLIRIALFPAVMIPVLLVLKVEPYLISMLVIVFATPAPLTAGAFANTYGGNAFFASKVVVLSNLLSLITMPILIFIFTTFVV